MRGKASFSSSLSLFILSRVLPRGEAKLVVDCSVSGSQRLMWLQGPFNGQRDKSFIWRSTSPPPLSLCLLGSLRKPVSAGVLKESSVCFCPRRSSWLVAPLTHPSVRVWHRVSIQKLYRNNIFVRNNNIKLALHWKTETQSIDRNQMTYSHTALTALFCVCVLEDLLTGANGVCGSRLGERRTERNQSVTAPSYSSTSTTRWV